MHRRAVCSILRRNFLQLRRADADLSYHSIFHSPTEDGAANGVPAGSQNTTGEKLRTQVYCMVLPSLNSDILASTRISDCYSVKLHERNSPPGIDSLQASKKRT